MPAAVLGARAGASVPRCSAVVSMARAAQVAVAPPLVARVPAVVPGASAAVRGQLAAPERRALPGAPLPADQLVRVREPARALQPARLARAPARLAGVVALGSVWR